MIYESKPLPRVARSVWEKIEGWLPAGYRITELWWNGPRLRHGLRWIFTCRNESADSMYRVIEGECYTDGKPSGEYVNARGSWDTR